MVTNIGEVAATATTRRHDHDRLLCDGHMPIQLIREIDECAARAWPAFLVDEVDGWRLRFTYNVTGRANSVLPIQLGGRYTLSERLERVEAFYRRWNAPVRYQITPAAQPPDLDQTLMSRGFHRVAPTLVQVAPVAAVLDACGPGPALDSRLTPALDETWFATYRRLENLSEIEADVIRGILRRIRQRSAYVLVAGDGQPIGTGLGVVDGDWIGVFCVVIDPDFRRIGAATTVLHALARWARRQHASRMYLQVTEQNTAARALYAGLGFETLYGYHYRALEPLRSSM